MRTVAAWSRAAADRWRAAVDREGGRFAPWLPVFMAAGVLSYLALRFEPPVWLGAAGFAASAAGFAALRRRRWPRLLLAPAAAFCLGAASIQCAAFRAPPPMEVPSRAVVLTGRLASVENLPEGRRALLSEARVEGDDTPLPRSVRLRLRPAERIPLAAGDAIRVRAMLRAVPPPAYPGGWDMQRDMHFAGVGALGSAIGPVEVLERAVPSAPARFMRRLAEEAGRRIEAAIPGPSGRVATGILVGDQNGISPADMAAFRDSGLAHILSVSGLHLAIVLGVAMGFFRLLLSLSAHASLMWPCKQIAAAAALAVGGFYTVLTGSQVPMLRCFFMAALIALATIAGRRPFSLHGLAVVRAAIVLIAPAEVSGASMQMSFSAVLALIAGFEALQPWLRRMAERGRVGRAASLLAGAMLTSLLAGTASLPYGAYHFGRVQIYYVLSNLVGVPLTSLLVIPPGWRRCR